jgi:signal transduction histidine kinase
MNGIKLHLQQALRLLAPLSAPQSQVESDVCWAQQVHLVRSTPILAAVTIAISTSVVVVMLPSSHLNAVLIWWALSFVAPIAWLLNFVRVRNVPAPDRVSGKSMRKSERWAVFSASVFGVAPWVFQPQTMVMELFFIAVQVAMVAGIVALLAAIPRIVLRYALCSLVPMVAYIYVLEPGFWIPVGLACLVFTTIISIGSNASYSQLFELVRSNRSANESRTDLMEAIESTNDGYRLIDAAGNEVLTNKVFSKWFPAGDHESLDDVVRVIHRNDRVIQRVIHPSERGGSVAIYSDITELTHRERSLEMARREAQDADDAKTRFLATMSHELITPLNAVIGFSSIMATDSKIEISETERRRYSDSILEAGQHLTAIVQDIVDYSKLGIDKGLETPEPFEVRRALQRAVSLAIKEDPSRLISSFDLAVSASLQEIVSDELTVMRVLNALISNAMKFSTTNAKITIRAGRATNGAPIILVRDEGIGIHPRHIDRVFDPFYQIDTQTNKEAYGIGLGLPLAEKLAEQIGARLSLKSVPGKGTCVTIIFPRTSAGMKPETDDVASPKKAVSAA